MPGKAGSEASSQAMVTEPAANLPNGGSEVERRMAEAIRRAREAVERARAKASGAPISSDAAISGDAAISSNAPISATSSAPVGVAKRAAGENRDSVPISSSEPIAKRSNDDELTTVRLPEPIAAQSAPIQNTPTRETSSPVHPPNWFVEQLSMATAARAAEAQPAPMELERRAPEPLTAVPAPSPAPLPSSEPTAKAPAEIQKTVAPESTSAVQSPAPLVEPDGPGVITVYRASDYTPLPDFETMALEFAARRQPLGRLLASWWRAIGSALRGRWRDAVWDFYERMTDVFWWWRAVIKPPLKYLFPGLEPRPTKLQKAIRECFREFHENPRPWPPHLQPKKPEDDRPKPPDRLTSR